MEPLQVGDVIAMIQPTFTIGKVLKVNETSATVQTYAIKPNAKGKGWREVKSTLVHVSPYSELERI